MWDLRDGASVFYALLLWHAHVHSFRNDEWINNNSKFHCATSLALVEAPMRIDRRTIDYSLEISGVRSHRFEGSESAIESAAIVAWHRNRCTKCMPAALSCIAELLTATAHCAQTPKWDRFWTPQTGPSEYRDILMSRLDTNAVGV